MELDWRNYIDSNTKILVGKPIIKGTRISVDLILELLSSGWTNEMILKSYPSLSNEDLKATFLFLQDCMKEESYFPTKSIA